MKQILAAFALSLGAGAGAQTGEPQTATAPATTASSEEAEKPICRTYRSTGSRARRERICMTAAEWQRFNEAGRREAGEITGSSGVCSGGDCRG